MVIIHQVENAWLLEMMISNCFVFHASMPNILGFVGFVKFVFLKVSLTNCIFKMIDFYKLPKY